jgi:hypothetical protein
MSNIPHCLDDGLRTCGEVGQPYAPAALYHQEDSWYSFLLATVNTVATMPLEKLRKLQIFHNFIGNRTRDLPASSILPQSTMLRTPAAL